MNAIVKRELKNYLRNPILYLGTIIVIIAIYVNIKPYLQINYFPSNAKMKNNDTNISDADIMDGYVPTTDEEKMRLGCEKIRTALIDSMGFTKEKADHIISDIQKKKMNFHEISKYLKEEYGFNGAEYIFDDLEYHQGNVKEVNAYIQEQLGRHPFSYFFSFKFADFCGLFMSFFATLLLAFLFIRDTKKDTYELLHTKPIRAGQYILGKITGGFLAILSVLVILNLIFSIACMLHGQQTGFPVEVSDIWIDTAIYILPGMLMITSIYAIIAIAFKNPLPAVPLLVLYIIYSNMGKYGADGKYGYNGRPLAILVRFPGRFFETSAAPFALFNQIFLIIASILLASLAILIWKRRRVY